MIDPLIEVNAKMTNRYHRNWKQSIRGKGEWGLLEKVLLWSLIMDIYNDWNEGKYHIQERKIYYEYSVNEKTVLLVNLNTFFNFSDSEENCQC